MVHETSTATPLAMLDALTAFAGGSLAAFGARTLVRRPLLAAWLLTLLLVPWTLFLAALATFSHLTVLSYDRAELMGWAAFDAAFVTLLVRAFLKPRVGSYMLLAALAACDGALAVRHLRCSVSAARSSRSCFALSRRSRLSPPPSRFFDARVTCSKTTDGQLGRSVVKRM